MNPGDVCPPASPVTEPVPARPHVADAHLKRPKKAETRKAFENGTRDGCILGKR